MSNTPQFPDRVNPRSYHKNPRQITGKQLNDLKQSLDRFGDLSGIVHNIPTNELVGGHMRDKAINIAECEIEIVQQFNPPTDNGTVALGYVIYAGERSDEMVEQANIQANSLGGDWDFDVLADQFEVDDLLDWGFTEFSLGLGNGGNDTEEELSNVEFQEFDETVAKTVKYLTCPPCEQEFPV